MKLRAILWIILPSYSLAQVSIQVSNVGNAGISAQQYVLTYTTGAPASSCTVDAFSDAAMTQEVNDTNPAVYANANLDTSRFPENAGLASRHFIIGTRKAIKSAATQHWVSLSLQAETQYWYRITCGTSATGTFTTTTIPLGTGIYNENYLADPAVATYSFYTPGAWCAYPEFTQWANDGGAVRQTANMETLIDPQTGVLLKKFTQPGDARGSTAAADYAPSLVVDLTGGKWSLANCGALTTTDCVATDDANYISYSGSTQDKLFLQDNTIWSSLATYKTAFDSIEFNVKAWAVTGTGANAQISVCLTTNRVNCYPTAALGKVINMQLTNTQGTVIGGDKTHYMLTDWMPAGYNNISTGSNDAGDIGPRNGTADVNSSGNVTLATSAELQGYRFYPNWTNGSTIHITNSDCMITSVASPQALTISLASCSPALTVGAGLSWSANNFGFLVWKTTTSADQINLQFAKWTSNTTPNPGWASSGNAALCGAKLVTRPSSGHTGYHCATRYDGSDWMYFVDRLTGETVPLGKYTTCGNDSACYNGADGWSQHSGVLTDSITLVDNGTNETFLTGTADNAGKSVLIRCTLDSTNEPGNLTILCTNMTPGSQGKDLVSLLTSFLSGHTPDFDVNRFPNGCGLASIQANQVMLGDCRTNGGQNSMMWFITFDPLKVCSAPGCVGGGSPGAIIGAVSSFGSTTPLRWAGTHGDFFSGWPSTKAVLVGYALNGGGVLGKGPYLTSYVSGNLTATPGHPCGSAPYPCSITVPGNSDPTYPAGAAVTVTGYDDWVVEGEPCNRFPVGSGNGFANGGTGEPYVNCPYHVGWDYIGAVQVGDFACMLPNANGPFDNCMELVYISAKSDATHWTVARGFGFFGGPVDLTSSQAIAMYQQGFYDWKAHSESGGYLWDYINDPYGQSIQKLAPLDHGASRAPVAMGDGGDAVYYSIQPYNSYVANFTDWTKYPSSFMAQPHFAGNGYTSVGLIDFSNTCQPHPSINEGASQQFSDFDLRPCVYLGSGFTGYATSPAANLWKFTSTTTDGDNLTGLGGTGDTGHTSIARKLQATMALAGEQPLIDVSGPGSTIDGTSAHAWQYCIARRAGECAGADHPATAIGDIYANWPYSLLLDNGNMAAGQNGGDRCNHGDFNCGLAFYNTGFAANNVSQIVFNPGQNTDGHWNRTVTYGLLRYRMQDDQGHVQPLPDSSWMIIDNGFGGLMGAGNEVHWIMAKIPSLPQADSFNRMSFIPASVAVAVASLPGGTTNIISRFGYAENGKPTSAYCTTRQEECIANYSGAVPTVPFSFPTDGSPATEAGVSGLACASGCTLTIPAIPQRVLYHQEVYRNASNTVLGTSDWTVTIPDTLQPAVSYH
jgi:hypothetical protein